VFVPGKILRLNLIFVVLRVDLAMNT
jgi:hypothetical protein